jgi:PAS domain S-box-containing protein
MAEAVQRFFSSDGFMPQGMSYLWKPELVWLHAFSDAFIAAAFVAVPFLLLYLVKRKGSDLPFHWMFVLFAVFTVACGLTHAASVWTLWNPHYWVSGGLKAITAVGWVAIAILLVPVLPRAVALRNPIDLERETDQRRRLENLLAEAEAIAHLGSWEWDVDADEVRWSAELYRIFGVEPDTPVNYERYLSLVHPEDRETVDSSVREAGTGGAGFQLDHRIVRQNGEVRFIHSVGRVAYNAMGEPRRMFGTAQDVTDRMLAEKARRESEERYRRIVELSQEGIWTIDAENQTTYVNRRMAEILGYEPEEMIGRSMFDFMDEEGRVLARRNVERRREGIREDHEFRFLHKDGTDVWTLLSTAPLMEGERYQGAVAMAIDITERRRADEALRESESRLAEAQAIAHVGSWSWEIPTNRVTWSDEMYQIYGLLPGATLSYETFLSRIHADDRERVKQIVDSSFASGEPYEFEFRIVQPSGEIRNLLSRGRAVQDAGGRTVRIHGTTQDVTEQKRSEESVHVLAHAGEIFGKELEFKTTLQKVSDLLIEDLADLCFFDLLRDDGTVERKAGAISDPEKAHLLPAMARFAPPLERERHPVPRVIRDGEPILVAHVDDDWLREKALNDEHLAYLRELAFQSFLVVPLVARGRIRGALTCARFDQARPFDDRDLELAEELGRRAGVALENARLHGALQESEERFRFIAEHADDMITLHDREGICTYASPAARQLTGYTPAELLGRRLGEVLGSLPADDQLQNERLQVLESGRSLTITAPIRRKDKREVFVEATVRAVLDDEGRVARLVVVTRDVTDRIVSAHLTELLERVTAAVSTAKTAGEALEAAIAGICDHTGWPVGHAYVPNTEDPQVLVPTGIWGGVKGYPDFRRITEQTTLRVGEGLPGRVAETVEPVWIPDTRSVPNFPRGSAATEAGLAAAFAFPVRVNGDLLAVLEFFCAEVLPPDERLLEVLDDIGVRLGHLFRRLEAETALRRSEQRYRFLADYSTDLITVLTPEGVCTYASPAARAVLGYGPDELVGHPVVEIVHPEDVDQVAETRRAILKSFASRSVICRLRRKAGGWVWAETTSRGVRDPGSGLVESIVAVTRNVSERIRAAETMRLLQRVTAIANESATIEAAMKAALEAICGHTGWPVGHAYVPFSGAGVVLKPTDIWHLQNPERYDDFRGLTESLSFGMGKGLPGRVLESGKPHWIEDVTSDPSFRRADRAVEFGLRSALAFPVKAAEETVAVLEFLAPETSLADREFLQVMENVGVQLGQVVRRQRVESALRASEVRFRALAETANDAILTIDDESRIVHCNAAVERIFGHAGDDLLGQSLVILMPERFRPLHREGVRRYLETGDSRIIDRTIELVGLHRDGYEVPIELSLSAWGTEDQTYFTGIVRDVTARKQAEEVLTEKMQELSRSNAELALFTYVASHDLREPLRTVASNVQLVERRLGDRLDSATRKSIQFALDGVYRMQRLIEDLLAYSRVGTEGREFEIVESTTLFDEARDNLRATIDAEGGEVTRDELPRVRGDRVQLTQVLQNLISNALKFHDERPPRVHVSAERDDDHWVFSVRDQGIGFDPAFADHVFTIFQRLHPPETYPGTGIGLAICRKIVERHGGRIWAESVPGEGSVFRFTLPTAD